MQLRLTDEAIEGLDRLRTRHHASLTAIIEALGLLGADRDPTIGEIIERARQVDHERRSRR